MSDTEDLRARLAEAEAQLKDINEALAVDPNDADFVAMKQDVESVIAMTRELIALEEAPQPSAPAPPASDASASAPPLPPQPPLPPSEQQEGPQQRPAPRSEPSYPARSSKKASQGDDASKKPSRLAKIRKVEKQRTARQQTWKDFQHKSSKKKTPGFFTGRKKESMFKSPEGNDGRVGVVGSGRGMTSFADRKKHVFQENES